RPHPRRRHRPHPRPVALRLRNRKSKSRRSSRSLSINRPKSRKRSRRPPIRRPRPRTQVLSADSRAAWRAEGGGAWAGGRSGGVWVVVGGRLGGAGGGAGERRVRVGGEVTAPTVIMPRVEPQYTELARKARIEGVVIIEAIIDRAGNVTDARVLKPLPLGLDQ